MSFPKCNSIYQPQYYPAPPMHLQASSAGLIMVAHYQLVHHHAINVPSPILTVPKGPKKRRQPLKHQELQIVNGVCIPLYPEISNKEMHKLAEIYVETVLKERGEDSLDILVASFNYSKEEFYADAIYWVKFNNSTPQEIFDLIQCNRYFIDNVMIPYKDKRSAVFIMEAVKKYVNFGIIPDDNRNICDLDRCVGDECTYRHDDSSPCAGDDCDFHHEEIEDGLYLCDRDGYVYDPFLNEEDITQNEHALCTGNNCTFNHVKSDKNLYTCESNGYIYYY